MKARRRKGSFCITLGVLLIAAALLLIVYNLWDSGRAKEASGDILEKMEAAMTDDRWALPGYIDPDGEMPTLDVDGYAYIGILEIPSLGLRLPVMDQWDYDRLRYSPCRYSGSYYSQDLVICAHNFASHFGPIRNVDMGADVYLITVKGQVLHYQVANRETMKPKAIEEMTGNTQAGNAQASNIQGGNTQNGNSQSGNIQEEWALTLFTCNLGGQTRCAVRCVLAE